VIGREGPGPERSGPDYPPEWDTEPEEGSASPECASCGGPCVNADDGWWTCTVCGDEWTADHHPRYRMDPPPEPED
jgi:ribosomal protein L37AE/L43A